MKTINAITAIIFTFRIFLGRGDIPKSDLSTAEIMNKYSKPKENILF